MKMRLKALRVNAQIMQKDAANALNVTTKTLQNWEDYKTFPDAPQLIRICKLYNCKLDDIFLPDALAKSEH